MDAAAKKTALEQIDVDAYCDNLAKSGSEHAHQRAVFGWLNHQVSVERLPVAAKLAFAVPNGGERNPIVAARLKTEGVKSGVPDIFLPVPKMSYAGLFVEMKVTNGKVSDTQKQWHVDLRVMHYAVAVCWGWRSARQCFLDYFACLPVVYEYDIDT